MKPSVEQLRKILELERAKGYQDRAVIGGLDSFLGRCATEKDWPQSELAHILSPVYAAMDLEGRARWVEKVLDLLSGITPQPERGPDQALAGSRKTSRNGAGHSLDAPLTAIKGIRASLAAKFKKLGVSTVRDMLYFFPRRHIDYSQLKPIAELEVGVEQTVVANIWQASAKTIGRRMRVTEAIVGDDSGNIRVVWFNQPYLARKLPTNGRLAISGKVSLFGGRKVFESPEYELVESEDLVHTGRLVPVYPLTAGLPARQVRRLVKDTVDHWSARLDDFLPQRVRESARLVALAEAIRQAHYPDSEPAKDRARRRLAFDELFLIQLGVMAKRRDRQQGEPGRPLTAGLDSIEPFLHSLPFALTSAQQRALNEIKEDLGRPEPMSRLLQGEVGSGKTVVAAAAMLLSVASGYQAALMAPTEVLAEQHFENICRLMAGDSGDGENVRSYSSLLPHPISIGLLSGSLRESAKQELRQRISEGEIDILIGTHALIESGVEFDRLALCVVDEQHRFGVMQRSALRHKGSSPHALVMSATPIPRTLALTLYGDLDLSVIDQLPPGRREIKTRWLSPSQRQSAYEFVRDQIDQGRQAFIVCPLIEQSKILEAKAATDEYQRLSRSVFPKLRLGLLHGRMPGSEKEVVMRHFRGGELDILVSTPVVEVGIDVPNATVMLVESADRFGLAQLHQFRGRVGRGDHQSYCLLLADTPSVEARERLSLLERTQDGFALAEEDLRLRGPGEFFGTRQSGLPDLKMASVSDIDLLELAREEAIRLFQSDPWLEKPEHEPLARELSRLWESGGEWS